MPKNPDFEIEQVQAYMDYGAKNTTDLEKTADSHFFPVLPKIFFYHSYEVRRDIILNDLSVPFDCVDVLGDRPRILVHFASTRAQISALPPFALKWGEDETKYKHPRLMTVQNRPNDETIRDPLERRTHWVSVLRRVDKLDSQII